MSKFLTIFFVFLGAFGLLAGLAPASAFSVEKATEDTKAAKVDVNNATEQELEELPGIGETYAKKIIDGRPYKTEDDLLKAGIPQKTVDKIKHSIKFGKVKKVKTSTKQNQETKAVSKSANTSTEDETAKVPPHKGMVWVNTETKVYHKEGDRWYGKTKHGEFMNEKDAIKYGARLSEQD